MVFSGQVSRRGQVSRFGFVPIGFGAIGNRRKDIGQRIKGRHHSKGMLSFISGGSTKDLNLLRQPSGTVGTFLVSSLSSKSIQP